MATRSILRLSTRDLGSRQDSPSSTTTTSTLLIWSLSRRSSSTRSHYTTSSKSLLSSQRTTPNWRSRDSSKKASQSTSKARASIYKTSQEWSFPLALMCFPSTSPKSVHSTLSSPYMTARNRSTTLTLRPSWCRRKKSHRESWCSMPKSSWRSLSTSSVEHRTRRDQATLSKPSCT